MKISTSVYQMNNKHYNLSQCTAESFLGCILIHKLKKVWTISDAVIGIAMYVKLKT